MSRWTVYVNDFDHPIRKRLGFVQMLWMRVRESTSLHESRDQKGWRFSPCVGPQFVCRKKTSQYHCSALGAVASAFPARSWNSEVAVHHRSLNRVFSAIETIRRFRCGRRRRDRVDARTDSLKQRLHARSFVDPLDALSAAHSVAPNPLLAEHGRLNPIVPLGALPYPTGRASIERYIHLIRPDDYLVREESVSEQGRAHQADGQCQRYSDGA